MLTDQRPIRQAAKEWGARAAVWQERCAERGGRAAIRGAGTRAKMHASSKCMQSVIMITCAMLGRGATSLGCSRARDRRFHACQTKKAAAGRALKADVWRAERYSLAQFSAIVSLISAAQRIRRPQRIAD